MKSQTERDNSRVINVTYQRTRVVSIATYPIKSTEYGDSVDATSSTVPYGTVRWFFSKRTALQARQEADFRKYTTLHFVPQHFGFSQHS